MTFYNNKFYKKDLENTLDNIVDVNKLFHKKILITGATGLIGSTLVESLLKLNELENAAIEIFALGRSKERLEQRFSTNLKNIHFIVQDVSNPINSDITVDIVIHAASNANPKAYSDDPIGTIKGNVHATLNLLDYCKQKSVEQFIFISSGEVYGELPREKVPFTEEMAGYINSLEVRSCYMLSKKMSENICISYSHQYGLITKIVRLSHVFGANYTSKDTRASASFFVEALEGNDIILRSLGNHLRSYVYISDAASGILSVVTVGEPMEAYNVTNTSNTVTLADFAKTIGQSAGVSVRFDISESVDPASVTPISFAVLSDEKLRLKNWQPQITVKTGIERIIDILREEEKKL
ncbi:NAD-dependent epimerase/dehydratase family protein [Lactococcus lactis]|uniref:NAD-dependent epimerase/dehydratase family protein n=1 Tax=Lactococcus lactis TaxID=1358 RepID=UPI0017826F8B|nr:NAD-dependent epimerase/dehydratase family protein [Lactococcus lactis]MBD5854207.1 NAD-dependent epimerase/dehydratase family protein [Lactococcus lactis]